MTEDICEGCRQALSGLGSEKLQAERVDSVFPGCLCEKVQVGNESPGPVADEEFLYRLIISPGDIDEEGEILLSALRTVKEDGLSVFRESASDDDIIALVSDRLASVEGSPTKVVQGLLRIQTSVVRALQNEELGRLFCVYDETVPRRVIELPRVPTHVTVLQRLYEAGKADRKAKITTTQKMLFDSVKHLKVDLAEFREGLLLKLNQQSIEGEFLLPAKVRA